VKQALFLGLAATAALLAKPPVSEGTLLAVDKQGNPTMECPLEHTDVKADISGFLARVTVTQQFHNKAADKIEAAYVFPLPHMAAVDRMDVYIGDRHVRGDIKRREEARAIYEAARGAGKMAALLDQERPNIFTQHVANIRAGDKVRIVISYVERLNYDEGSYEWVFPMVVGPRYIPGKPAGRIGGGWSHDTDRVPDASRITPPVAKPGTRAGHDISLAVNIDAGVPIQSLSSKTHEVFTERPAPQRASIRLKDNDVIPNKDFVLRYDVSGRRIEDSVLTHRAGKSGFFTLILQPPDKTDVEDITPKELVFVLDTSGSMSGFPIEKAKETMRLAIEGLNPRDTFNLITFAGDTHILFPHPVPATADNVRAAQQFLASRRGGGGTEMMKAITAALAPSGSEGHIRIVCFMTDGYIGNEAEIIGAISSYSKARVFSFGIGSSVNRYLLDKMAETGRGETEYVSLQDDGSAAAKRFHERVRNPLLTDIVIDWGDLPVTEIYPKRIPDVFSAKPIVVTGRYSGPAIRKVKLRGRYAGQPVVREIEVKLPSVERKHDVLATLWARTKVDVLMHEPNGREEIAQLGLDYRLMTPYTSFVAVEETIVTDGGKPRRVDVPVEMPEGVRYEGVFGGAADEMRMTAAAPMRQKLQFTPGVIGGVPGGRTVRSMPSPAPNATPAIKIDPGLLKRTGKVEIRIWLVEASDQVLAELKKLGFEMTVKPVSGKMVIGRIEAAKLKQLSELPAVKYVAPAQRVE
jgi:Ca-activated chloride channel homolog